MAESIINKPILANVKSLELFAATVVTGTTGNVSCSLINDGKTIVFGGYCNGGTCVVLPFVSATNSYWYVKVRNAENMEPVANTSIELRYYIVRLN